MMAFTERPQNGAYIPERDEETRKSDPRDERSETDPTSALTMREIADLRWFWNEKESDVGVRSAFGVQLEAALAQRISDDAMHDARVFKALVSRLRKGWRPKKAQIATQKRRSPITQAFLDHVGVPDIMIGDGNFQKQRIAPDKLDLADYSDQTIYMRAPAHAPPQDPYENDRVLVLVQKARRVRSRLVRLTDRDVLTLNAAYGESKFGEEREALRKRLGVLTSIIIALVAQQRKDGDPPARSIVRAKLHDDSFVRIQKHVAGGHLRRACKAYAETRS